MRQRDRSVKAPLVHRLLMAVVWPVVGFFVARLVIRVTPVPDLAAYVLGIGAGLVVAYRALVGRVVMLSDAIVVHNTIATATVPRETIKRINEIGRIEWHNNSARAIRLPSEALHDPRWAFGTGAATYQANRELVRDWLRQARRRAGEQESYTDVLPAVPPLHAVPPTPSAPPVPPVPPGHSEPPGPPVQPPDAAPAVHPDQSGRTAWMSAEPSAPEASRDTTGSLPKVVPGNTWRDPLDGLGGDITSDEGADDWLRRWDERNAADRHRPDEDWRQSGTA